MFFRRRREYAATRVHNYGASAARPDVDSEHIGLHSIQPCCLGRIFTPGESTGIASLIAFVSGIGSLWLLKAMEAKRKHAKKGMMSTSLTSRMMGFEK